MHENVQQVINAIVENRRKFEEFCYSLSDEEQRRPVPGSTWIVKDFAAHLGTLDTTFVAYVNSVAEGGQMDNSRDASGAAFDLDAWNDAQVAERRDWPLAKVFEEASANRAALIGAMGRLEQPHLDANMHFTDRKRGTADFPLKAFLIGWSQHDPIHVADMVKALPERASDTELQAWLANPFVTGYQVQMAE